MNHNVIMNGDDNKVLTQKFLPLYSVSHATLSKKKKNIDLVDDLAGQLLWAFNIDSPEKRRELIEDLLKANNLLPT